MELCYDNIITQKSMSVSRNFKIFFTDYGNLVRLIVSDGIEFYHQNMADNQFQYPMFNIFIIEKINITYTGIS